MTQEHQTKKSTQPAPVATKKSPAPVQKNPNSSHDTQTASGPRAPDPGGFGNAEWELVAPSKIEIFGSGKGKQVIQHIWIPVRLPTVMEHQGPLFRAAVSGGDWLTVRQVPAILPVVGFDAQMKDPSFAIELTFNPPDDAVFQGLLEIDVLDAPRKMVRIPVHAYSDMTQQDVMHGPQQAPRQQPIPAPQPAPVKAPQPTAVKAPPTTDSAKKAPPPTPAVPIAKDQKSRLLAHSTDYNFDEQIVGSRQSGQISAPTNLHGQPAIAYFGVQGDGFTLMSTSSLSLSAMSAGDAENIGSNSPLIMYAPTRPGAHHGVLTIAVGWGDNVHELQTVTLRGRARTAEQAPSPEKTAAETQQEASAAKVRAEETAKNEKATTEEEKNEKKKPLAERDFDGSQTSAAARAMHAAEELNKAQEDGCEIVEKEATAYKKLPEKVERSIWWDLAEIALTMATAGIANHLAKNVFPKVFSAATSKIIDVKDVRDHIDSFAYVMMTSPAKFSEFTTDAVKEGLKNAGKAAIKAAKPGSGSASHGGDGDGSDGEGYGNSSNPRIDFFAEQRNIIRHQLTSADDAIPGTKELVGDRVRSLRPLARVNPKKAIAILDALADGFKDTTAIAAKTQAAYVAPQWAAFVARMSLGSEAVVTAKSTSAGRASRTQILRPNTPAGMPKAVDGVLDIFLANEFAPPQVVRARLHGSSYSMADRLAGIPLANVMMPIRFVLGTNNFAPTFVTRDESGRVRVTGNYAPVAKYSKHSTGAATEADAIAGAHVMIDWVLSRPLADWSIRIVTDDATPREGVGK